MSLDAAERDLIFAALKREELEPEQLGGFIPDDEHSQNPRLWDYLIEVFKPKTMLDVGCGLGHAAKYFLDRDIDAYGIDGSKTAQKYTVLPSEHFIFHNFVSGVPQLKYPVYDLVWSCEFVEHIEEQYADNFLQVFALGKVVAMTHAFPDQGGYHHVNCQPRDYWVTKMRKLGFTLSWLHTRVAHTNEFVQSPLNSFTYWGSSGMVFVR